MEKEQEVILVLREEGDDASYIKMNYKFAKMIVKFIDEFIYDWHADIMTKDDVEEFEEFEEI